MKCTSTDTIAIAMVGDKERVVIVKMDVMLTSLDGKEFFNNFHLDDLLERIFPLFSC